MKVNFPVPKEDDLFSWAKRLLVVLVREFNLIQPQLQPGVIILWDASLPPPPGFLLADGSEYPKDTYVSLGRLFPDSTPGNFEVPSVTPPSGTAAFIKT